MGVFSLPAAASTRVRLAVLTVACVLPSTCRSATFTASGAGAVGNFGNPGVWGPNFNAVPGPGDTAILNDNSSAIGGPSMNLNADTTVAVLQLANANPVGASARLDLNGFNLIATQSITVGAFGGFGILDGRSAFMPAHFETPLLTVTSAVNSNFFLYQNDRVGSLGVNTGAEVTTSDTQNLSTGVSVLGDASTLNLGAGLVLTQDLVVRGVGADKAFVDAQGSPIMARDIRIGQFNNAGDILNDGVIHATQDLEVSRGTFTLDEDDIVGRTVIATNTGVLTLDAATAAQNATVTTAGRINTVAAGNLSVGVLVLDAGSLLDLGAELTLSQDLVIRGTNADAAVLDTHGHDIQARDIRIGQFGNAGAILNDAVIHATQDLEVSRGTFTLDADDIVGRTVIATNTGVLMLDAATAAQNATVTTAGRINTVAAGNLSVGVLVLDAGSLLDLGAELTLSQDLVIRGTNADAAVLDTHGHDIQARDIRIGQFGNAGAILNDAVIHATQDLEVSRGTFTLDADDIVGRTVIATNTGVLMLDAATAAQNATVTTAGRINTMAAGNLSVGVLVLDAGSLLDLGAELTLSQDLVIRGTNADAAVLDTHGHDIQARDIRIGQFGNAGEILNDAVIQATQDLEVSRGTFTLDADDIVGRTVIATNTGVLMLDAATAAQNATVTTAGRINTVVTGNLSVGALVLDADSLLDLGADLTLSQDLVIRGTNADAAIVDAHGHDIVARHIRIGQFGSAGDILNDAVLHATQDLEVSRGAFTLDADDIVERALVATNGGVLTVDAATASQSATVTTGGRINTVDAQNLSVSAIVTDAGSLLDLGADLTLSQDLAIRGTAAGAATVDAHGNDIVALDIRIGQFGSAGAILNDNVIHATRDLEVSRGTFTLDSNDVVGRSVIATNTGVLTLDAATAAENATITSAGRINTVAAGNLSVSASVADGSSLLNLGADLTLSLDLAIRGTAQNGATPAIPGRVDANGHDITARHVSVGQFNTPGEILNDGKLTAERLFVERSTLTLTGGDDVVQTEIDLRTASTLSATQALNENKGLTFDGATLDILDTSVLSLDFDANTDPSQLELDFAFRWRNPVGGDRIAAINSLVSAGRIVINAPVQTVVFDNDDGYTYVGLTPDPAILAGDYNGDGVVDAADYTVWRDNLGMPEGTLQNDISIGPIGEAQYLVWKNRFGNTLTPAVGATSVPEPNAATLGLLLLALVASLRLSICERRPIQLASLRNR